MEPQETERPNPQGYPLRVLVLPAALAAIVELVLAEQEAADLVADITDLALPLLDPVGFLEALGLEVIAEIRPAPAADPLAALGYGRE